MATILIYNNDRNVIERYELGESSSMPYNAGGSLTVREFRGNSRGQYLWTDKRTMQAWNVLRRDWGKPIHIGACFKRIWEGGHAMMSQHYAGTAFDMGQDLSNAERDRLWQTAQDSGVWVYVEPQNLTPSWVHVDKRFTPGACPTTAYPLIKQGSRNQYVCIAQDALTALGYSTKGLDGIFGANTRSAAIRFQRANGLSADGVIGCGTWRTLTSNAVGIGRTATTLP